MVKWQQTSKHECRLLHLGVEVLDDGDIVTDLMDLNPPWSSSEFPPPLRLLHLDVEVLDDGDIVTDLLSKISARLEIIQSPMEKPAWMANIESKFSKLVHRCLWSWFFYRSLPVILLKTCCQTENKTGPSAHCRILTSDLDYRDSLISLK